MIVLHVAGISLGRLWSPSHHTHTITRSLSVLRLFRVFLRAPPLLEWVEGSEDGKELTGDT